MLSYREFNKIMPSSGPSYPYKAPKPTLKKNVTLFEICAALGKALHLKEVFKIFLPRTSSFYDMFAFAAANGQLVIFNMWMDFPGIHVQLNRWPNHLLRLAAKNGHLDVVNRLLELEALRSEIRRGHGLELDFAFSGGHDAIVRRLLDFEGPLRYAADHPDKFAVRFVHPLIVEKLKILAERRAAFEASHPGAEFDITSDEAPYYFYLLKNLICCNDSALQGAIRQLLHLKSLAPILTLELPTSIANNELLRLAASVGNSFAVKALLEQPVIYELAKIYNYYQEEGPAIALQAWAIGIKSKRLSPLIVPDLGVAVSSEATLSLEACGGAGAVTAGLLPVTKPLVVGDIKRARFFVADEERDSSDEMSSESELILA